VSLRRMSTKRHGSMPKAWHETRLGQVCETLGNQELGRSRICIFCDPGDIAKCGKCDLEVVRLRGCAASAGQTSPDGARFSRGRRSRPRRGSPKASEVWLGVRAISATGCSPPHDLLGRHSRRIFGISRTKIDPHGNSGVAKLSEMCIQISDKSGTGRGPKNVYRYRTSPSLSKAVVSSGLVSATGGVPLESTAVIKAPKHDGATGS
jgi:hypothetical protein